MIKESFSSIDNDETFSNNDSFENDNQFIFSFIKDFFLRRKKIILVTGITLFTLFGIETIYQRIYFPVYKGSFSLLISDPISPENDRNKGNLFEQITLTRSRKDIPSLIALLKSPTILSSISDEFGMNPKNLSNRISIKLGGSKESKEGVNSIARGILIITLRDLNPKRAYKILDRLSQKYIEVAYNNRRERITEVLAFLDDQTPRINKTSNDIQIQLEQFRLKNKLIDPYQDAEELKRKNVELRELYQENTFNLQRLQKAKQDIIAGNINAIGFKEALSPFKTPQVETQNSLSLVGNTQEILEEIIKIEKELAEARLVYTKNSYVVRNLENKLEILNPLIKENQEKTVNLAIDTNNLIKENLEKQLIDIEKELIEKTLLLKEFELIKQKLNVSQENLSSLFAAKERFQLEMAEKTIPWKIISEPFVSQSPISPILKRAFFKDIAIAGLLSLLLAFIRDRFDNVYHTSSEITALIDKPILEEIQYFDIFNKIEQKESCLLEDMAALEQQFKKDKNSKRYEHFLYQETFRNLYTSIRFLSTDKQIKTIVMSSTIPKEGKSLISVLLSKTISEMDKKVLLIDADLRKSQIHKRCGVDNFYGLSNLITDQNNNWRKAVKNVEMYPNLSIITAGIRPPDPTRLLGSNKLKQVINEIEKTNEFDFIMIDTPPMLGLADSSLFASICDGLIVVVSLNGVDKKLPGKTFQKIKDNKLPLLGVITNQIKEPIKGRGGKSSYYYYSDSIYSYYSNDDNDNFVKEENAPDQNETENSISKIKKEYRKQFDKIKKIFISTLNWLDN